MYVHAIHNGTDEVVILEVISGNPKNYAEVMIVFFLCSTCVLYCDNDLTNFIITE
ncbi:hypothetical protein LCGC14_2163130 [marine sediment metagenome]|uniref:Uncharacterized protein n=1 Tax=marine sediment metagenome TaxID=412755 RepID=A0A0F9GN97_9ZZZZ